MNLPTSFTFAQHYAALTALGISEDDAKHIARFDMAPHAATVTFYLTRDGQHYLIPETDEIAQAEVLIPFV